MFGRLIQCSEQGLRDLLKHYNQESHPSAVSFFTETLGLNQAQLICALGFNQNLCRCTDLGPRLGFDTTELLIQQCNQYFTHDIYRHLSLDNIRIIYNNVASGGHNRRVFHGLLFQRLQKIEARIENTVNALTINRYRGEARALYMSGVADADFAERRLEVIDNGFRSLINEVTLIVEGKAIPADDIFFRDMIMPAEKLQLLDRGLVPLGLVRTRLRNNRLNKAEKRVLTDYLQLMRPA